MKTMTSPHTWLAGLRQAIDDCREQRQGYRPGCSVGRVLRKLEDKWARQIEAAQKK